MIIREAKARDIDACLEIEASQMDTTFSEQDYLNSMDNPDVIFLVAGQDDEVVGYTLGFVVPTKNAEAMIHSTMVHKAYSRRGVGSRLVEKFLDVAFGRGVKKVFAEVEEGPDRFYEKCGFKKVGVWHSMCVENR